MHHFHTKPVAANLLSGRMCLPSKDGLEARGIGPHRIRRSQPIRPLFCARIPTLKWILKATRSMLPITPVLQILLRTSQLKAGTTTTLLKKGPHHAGKNFAIHDPMIAHTTRALS